jgi:hypothetical protein
MYNLFDVLLNWVANILIFLLLFGGTGFELWDLSLLGRHFIA